MKNTVFNPEDFGLKGKNLALVDFDLILEAFKLISEDIIDDVINQLREKYAFHLISVRMESGQLQGKRLGVVDADQAPAAFDYIRSIISQKSSVLSSNTFEFQLFPIESDEEAERKKCKKTSGKFFGLSIEMMVTALVIIGLAENLLF
ncbi:hypothetical protein [Rheinheimera hassiensis]|uniref:hypothetical protein n=1 Tax=Rheinheimera hassiensis TaxID=1193627 RepID=UPI001F051EA3|nr:hypothetical protein [Rheinheimera hassiensis]